MPDYDSKLRYFQSFDLQNKLPVIESKNNDDILLYIGVAFFIILII